MKLITTKDKTIVKFLKALGMPSGCIGASISFDSNDVVRVNFTKAIGEEELPAFDELLEDLDLAE